MKILKQLNWYLLVIIICINSNKSYAQHGKQRVTHRIVIEEFMHATNYTYLKVLEDTNKYWMAIPKREVGVGEIYFYKGGMQMGLFTSSDLKRTFDSIIFANGIESQKETGVSNHHSAVQQKDTLNESINIEPIKGGVTIAELLANKSKYAEKEILIKGQVVKVNTKILGRNWIHIQDGTNFEDKHNFTTTTHETVNVGDIVIFKGKIVLDQNFGSGYDYEILMEEAVIQ